VPSIGGRCEFDNEPIDIGFYWDTTCELGELGCNGDGKHVKCRLCGGRDFIGVPCPARSCTFATEPLVPYYWDTACELGKLGCWADGVHAQCRFCGDFPYTGVACPEGTAPPKAAACAFDNTPETPYYWDPKCFLGMHGCNADGKHVHCRFCGQGGFSDIHCPGSQVCDFDLVPTVPYYWDPECREGMLGCKADGVHPQCRFCAERPFESVPCPESVAPKEGVCVWPQRGEPLVTHFWDESCKMGMLGCWADGIHAECRFCGMGVFSKIPCPSRTTIEPANMLRR